MILTLIIFGGVFFRFYRLDFESLIDDEGITCDLTQKSVPQIINDRAGNFHPPLYFLFMRYWVKFFGDSEASLRLPSAVFGSLAIIAVYWLGTLLFGRKTALYTTFLFSFSNFQIYYSKVARMYSLMVLLTALSMYFFIKVLRSGKTKEMLAYLASTILLIYTHFYGFFTIMTQNIFFFYKWKNSPDKNRPSLKKWIFSQLLLGILFLPWLPFFWKQFWKTQEVWFQKSLAELIINFLFSLPLWVIFCLALPLILFFLAEVFFKRNPAVPENYQGNILFLLIWFLPPVLGTWALSIYFPKLTFILRAFLPLFIPFFLFTTCCLQGFSDRKVKGFLFTALTIWVIFLLGKNFYPEPQFQSRQIAAFLKKNHQEGDLLLSYRPWNAQNYYFKKYGLKIKTRFILERTKPARPVQSKDLLMVKSEIGHHRRVWLLLNHSQKFPQLIPEYLNENFTGGVCYFFSHPLLYFFEK